MSAFTRYKLLKKMNYNSIVLLKGRKKYLTFEKDLQLLNYIDFKFEYRYNSLKFFDKYNINYVVLDNLDVIEEKKYLSNNYKKFLKLSYLCKILNQIGNY